MKKLIILLIAAVFIFLWLIKAPIMSSYLSAKVGVPVTLRTISMWPRQTTIRHFRIANPHGYGSRSALEVQKITIGYHWGALTGTPHEIEEITLNGVDLNIDVKNATGSDNNWSVIGAQMPETRGGKEVIVHKLVILNLTVRTEGAGAKELGVQGTRYFERMEFYEINSKEGFPTKELIHNIFRGAGLRKLIENFLNPERRIKQAIDLFHIFGKKPSVEAEGFSDGFSNPFPGGRQHRRQAFPALLR